MKFSSLFLVVLIYANFCLGNGIISAEPNRSKINAEGIYLPFPGFTMVADIADKDKPFFQALHDRLAQIPFLTEHYGLLPVSSYHMTTVNLYTKYPELANTWEEFIK